ncbi:DUF4097 family beta strand repeat-containing protein [Hymenobacter sp. HD11105]
MIKTLLLTLLYLLALGPALWAQDYRLKLAGNPTKVVLEMRSGQVKLEGYNGNEILIAGNGFEPAPKQAEGLRAVFAGEDNTRIGLSVTQKDNAVRIVQASRKDTDYVIRVPRQLAVVFHQQPLGAGGLKVTDLLGDVEVNMQNGNVELLNMSGGVVVSLLAGNITVRYTAIGKAPSAISNLGGDIDVTMPARSKTTLELRTMSGDVYTDFDIALGKEAGGLRRLGGQVVGGAVNGGGTNVSIQALGGNIFLRKAK